MTTVERLKLVRTKLYRPSTPRGAVTRPRLLEQLNRGLAGPLTLVCAPAGFGKTTLVSSWIEDLTMGGATPPPPAAWLSLDETDSDPTLFLHYVVAALRTLAPKACHPTLELLRAPTQPPDGVLLTTLTNDLARLPARLVLILDDFHTISGEAVPDLLSGLVRRWPASLHLVLISRSTPPLPLANLRAKGQVSEIRGRDLRFTPEEAAAFLRAAAPTPLDESTVALLKERTEGWIAGLQLAALSLAAADDVESAARTLESADIAVADYLVDEVLARQPDAIQKFLLLTSILDRFCVELCEAIVGEHDPKCDARACMDWSERANLFVVSLDKSRDWYRYHHLFQELLQRRLQAAVRADQIIALHRRAAEWLAARGFVDEALRHALATADLDLVARLMEAGLCDVLNREDRPTLERWLHLLPEDFIQRRPGILIFKVWAMQLSWQPEAQWRLLQQVEALLGEEGAGPLTGDLLRVLRGQLAGFYGQAAYFRNEMAAAVAFCAEALALLPPSWLYARGAISVYLGLAMQAGGQGRAAERLLLDRYEALSDKTTNYAQRLLLAVSFIYLQDGQLEQLKRTAQAMLQQATQSGLMILRCWAHHLLGTVHYQQNELAAARQHFTVVIENRYVIQALTVTGSFPGLVLTQQAQGEPAEADRTLAMLSRANLQARGVEEEHTRSLRARLALLRGDLEDAARWADTLTSAPTDRPLLWLEEPHLTKARILLARGGEGDVQAAVGILDGLSEFAQRACNSRFQIEILALQAAAFDLRGKPDAALAQLRQAVDLARPGGFIRVFVDAGPRLRGPLLHLSGQGYAVETIRRILAAFPVSAPDAAASRPKAIGEAANASLIEPLTGREMDILLLLRERLSNKEIAQKLSLSPLTVKRHTVNLYGKLGVNRRWDAVTQAESLGLLLPR